MRTTSKHSQIKKTPSGESRSASCSQLPDLGTVNTDPVGASYMDRIDLNKKIRSDRLRAAKLKGDHTKEEWAEMVDFFRYTCVRCLSVSGKMFIEKDHIIPIYQGGSNGLDNIQPLCYRCNRSKGPENIDWRPQAEEFWSIIMPDKYKKIIK